jgi:iron complex outermembrane receptor protein
MAFAFNNDFKNERSEMKKTKMAMVVTSLLYWGGNSYTYAQVESDSADETEESKIETIQVTSRKVSESIQDVPIAVSAFTEAGLTARGITNISEIGNFTPGLEIDAAAPISGSSAAINTFIRGIGTTDFLLTNDPGVGLYIDDVYVGRSVGGLVDLLDIERVEILKGPQGTLFGRNTIGGAVSIISKDPGDQLAGFASITGGTDNRFDVRGKIEVPLSDRWFSSFTFSSKTQDGYVERLAPPPGVTLIDVPQIPGAFDGGGDALFSNGDPLGEENLQSGRLKLFYDGDNFDARIAIDGSVARETAPAQTLLGFTSNFGTGATLGDAHNALAVPAGRPAFDERFITGDPDTTFSAANGDSDYDLFGISAILQWSIGNVDVKSITAYRALDADFSRDGDATPLIIDQTRNQYEHNQFSQEFQLTGLAFDDRLKWLGGVYYFLEDGEDRVQVPLGLEVDLTVGGAPGTVINLFLDELNDVRNTSVAIFAQGTYDITDKLSATLGARYTEDEKEYRPTHVTLGVNPQILLIDEDSADFTDFSPRLSVDYRWNKQLFTYASFSQGFKSGGFTGRTVDPQQGVRSFEPEEAETVEVGAKIDFSSVRINAALFSTDYTNLQVTNQEGVTPITVNAGESEINGFEVELTAFLTDDFQINAGYSYIDAEFIEITDPNATITIDNEFANIPENSFNVAGDYFVYFNNGGELRLHADYVWKDDHFNDAENDPLLFQESFGLVGLSATYTTPNADWSVIGGVINLTDERFIFTGFSQPGVGFVEGGFNRGREFYLTVQYAF